MRTIAAEVTALEIYSIDECFADVSGIPDVDAFCRRLKDQIRQYHGMSVSLSTSPHDEGPQHHGSIGIKLSAGTSDTRLLVEAACRGLEEIFAQIWRTAGWG